MTTLADPASTLAGITSAAAAVVHLRQRDGDGGRFEVPIGCRFKRRLGQHAALPAGGPVGLDSYLSRQRAHSTAQRRIVVISAEHRDQMLTVLTTHAGSDVLVRIAPDMEDAGQQVEHWMLDQDQLAALLGERWGIGDETKLRPCCGSWVAGARSLHAPSPALAQGQPRKTGKQIRNELGDFPAYGNALDKPEVPEASREFRVRASVGSGSGRPGIQLNADHLEYLRSILKVPDLDFGSWVSVVHEFNSAVGPDELRVPATLRERPSNHPLDRREVGVDQVIRVALGVTEWEKVSLEAIVGERWAHWNVDRETPQNKAPRAGDRLANRWAPAVHVVARVQPAELTLTEQRACLLSPLALDSLGLKSGDEIVIHSVQSPVTDPRGSVHVKFRLKAYAATEDVTERRMMIHGGGRGAPLPSEDAAFHISQVLPWIWLDEAVRAQMGLPGQLSAVIVAPSRRYVLLDNLREVAIVGAVALGGVAASLGGVWRDVCGILAVVLPLMLIGLRVRSKLR